MDTASGKSQDLQGDDENSKDQDIISNLTIWVDSYGEVKYNMDWQDGETGIFALSKIFYELVHNGYAEMILSKMREQCVLNNTELEFDSFVKLIHYHDVENDEEDVSKENEFKNKPFISPDKSAYTI